MKTNPTNLEYEEEIANLLETPETREVVKLCLIGAANEATRVSLRKNLNPKERAGEFVTQLHRQAGYIEQRCTYKPNVVIKYSRRALAFFAYSGNWKDILELNTDFGWNPHSIFREIVSEAKSMVKDDYDSPIQKEKPSLVLGKEVRIMQECVLKIQELTKSVASLNDIVKREVQNV